MRRALVLLAVVAIGLPGCNAAGPNAEDERRVEVLQADPLLVTVPPGGSVTSEPSGDTASSDLPWDEGGGRNSASAVHGLAGTELEAARFYVDALVDQGWTEVQASCTQLSDSGRWVIGLGARRWYDGFEGRASVSVEPSDATTRAVVAVKAPYHTEDGDQPAAVEPSVGCLDTIG